MQQPKPGRQDSAQAGMTRSRRPDGVDLDLDELVDDIDWGELQEFFLTHLQGQLDQMDAWLRRGETVALGRVGHGLKGSGGGVRLPRFTELGRALEAAAGAGDLIALRTTCLAIRKEYLRLRPEETDRFGQHFEV